MPFSRPAVKQPDSFLYLFLGDGSEDRFLGEELPQESVGVFIASSFPGMVGMGEVDSQSCLSFR